MSLEQCHVAHGRMMGVTSIQRAALTRTHDVLNNLQQSGTGRVVNPHKLIATGQIETCTNVATYQNMFAKMMIVDQNQNHNRNRATWG